MNYLRQVTRGIDYVEEHLGDDIELADVSRATGVSHWHFLRMFKALTNETLKSYIRARRLANARVELLTTSDGVLEVALRAGFESQASFTRAFRRAFGMPPGKYRTLGGDQVHLTKLRIDEDYLRHLEHGVSRAPIISTVGVRHMVGCVTRYYSVDSEKNNIAETLPPLWAAFLERMGNIEDAIAGRCYGIIRQADEESDHLEYTAAVEVRSPPKTLPPKMEYRIVPASDYALFTHRGLPTDIDNTVSYIYSTWLLAAGQVHTYGPDIEVYDERWIDGSPDSIMEYAIPISPGSDAR